MCEEVLVKVTVNPESAGGTGSPQALNPSLKLEKIYKQIIERETQDKEKAKQKAKKLLLFLIAVEAVEKIDDVTAKKEFKITLPKDVAKLLVGKLDLKLTGSTGVVSNQQPKTECFTANNISQSNQDTKTVCVKVVVGNTTSKNNTHEIDGEFYQENKKDKWRPWWRSSTSTNQGGEWKIPVPSGWPDNPNQDKLDPDNPASKCVIFLRDILEAKTGKYICPWSGEKELLMEITKGSGKPTVTTDNSNKKKFTFDETGTGASFELLGVPTIDHLVPQSIGGANHTNNLLTVSQRANFAKGNFFPPEPNSWLTRDSYIKACKKAANSPATFVNVMRKYINESYNPPS
jgi:hypothetical protein